MFSKTDTKCRLCLGKGVDKEKGPSFKARFRGWCDDCYNAPTGVERLEQQGKIRITRQGIQRLKPNYDELIEREP